MKLKDRISARIPEEKRRPIRKALRAARVVKNIICWTMIVILSFAVITFLLTRFSGGTPSVFGYTIQRITSGSMEPALMVGDVILSKKVEDVESLAEGDIITFAGVDSLDVHISVAAQLKVAMHDYGTDLSRYGKVITNEMIDEFLAGDSTKLSDIVLDPVTTSNGTRFTNKGGAERQRNNRSFLEFDCWFIATEEMWVHLTTESAENQPDSGTRVSSDSPAPKTTSSTACA